MSITRKTSILSASMFESLLGDGYTEGKVEGMENAIKDIAPMIL